MYLPEDVTSTTSSGAGWTIRVYTNRGATIDARGFDLFDRACVVCGRNGPGMTEMPDGRLVHRWPCRDMLRP
jgi:hypothetical protein